MLISLWISYRKKPKNLIGMAAILREGHKMTKTEGKLTLINIFGFDYRDFEQGDVGDIGMLIRGHCPRDSHVDDNVDSVIHWWWYFQYVDDKIIMLIIFIPFWWLLQCRELVTISTDRSSTAQTWDQIDIGDKQDRICHKFNLSPSDLVFIVTNI